MFAPHDLSHCHDEACIRASDCWRYTMRLVHKWARHELSLRPLGDSGRRCPFYLPNETPDELTTSVTHPPKTHPETPMPNRL